ncbi:hypothetical protein P3T23_006286 [Paraburkholderia sp. GAS448]
MCDPLMSARARTFGDLICAAQMGSAGDIRVRQSTANYGRSPTPLRGHLNVGFSLAAVIQLPVKHIGIDRRDWPLTRRLNARSRPAVAIRDLHMYRSGGPLVSILSHLGKPAARCASH